MEKCFIVKEIQGQKYKFDILKCTRCGHEYETFEWCSCPKCGSRVVIFKTK